MPVICDMRPGYRYRRRFVVDDVEVTVRLEWSDRTGAAYLDILTGEGDPLVRGQRMSPGADPIPDKTLDGVPPGRFYVEGNDPYLREQIGDSVRLLYFTADDVAAGLYPLAPLNA